MGLRYDDLDDITRRFMLEELAADVQSETLYLSARLTQGGQGNWSDLLLDAFTSGTDVHLASILQQRGYLNVTEYKRVKGRLTHARVPSNANTTLAEGEFNRFYIRGLCKRAIGEKIPRLEVYRAKPVQQERDASAALIGLLMEPEVVLRDLRLSTGVDTALGVPGGPNSGLSLRIPISMREKSMVEETNSQKLDKLIAAVADLRTQLENVSHGQTLRLNSVQSQLSELIKEVKGPKDSQEGKTPESDF